MAMLSEHAAAIASWQCAAHFSTVLDRSGFFNDLPQTWQKQYDDDGYQVLGELWDNLRPFTRGSQTT